MNYDYRFTITYLRTGRAFAPCHDWRWTRNVSASQACAAGAATTACSFQRL